MITAIVVDDEALARDELIYLLQKTGRVRVLAEGASGADGLALVKRHHPDVLFLDVQMPEISGFEVAAQLLSEPGRPEVVFATAHDEYALQAFEVHAIDYLLKPFDRNRVVKAVQRVEDHKLNGSDGALDQWQSFLTRMGGPRPVQRLPLERNGRTVLVSPTDVLYASTGEAGTLVKTVAEEFCTQYSLQELEERLPAGTFLRIHRQYLVNLERVAEYIPWPGGTASVVLSDKAKSRLPVARTQVKRIKELLGMELRT